MIKNVYTTRPNEIKPGDVFVVTVAFHVVHESANGKLFVKAYRCPYPDPETDEEGVPQGDSIDPVDCGRLMAELAPVLVWARTKAI